MDEHYYSTAMAVHGKQWETDCKGVLSSGNFLCVPSIAHPEVLHACNMMFC